MGSRSHVLGHHLARGLWPSPRPLRPRGRGRGHGRGFAAAIVVCMVLALFAQPAKAKREAKGRGPNCSSQGGGPRVGGGTVLKVFSRDPLSRSAGEFFLPKIFRDDVGAHSRWMWRSRHSHDSYLLPAWTSSHEGSVLLEMWGDEGEGNFDSFCKGNSDGTLTGCRKKCNCPYFQQCYVHNEDRGGGSQEDIGECSLSMTFQVIISVATIGLLVVLLLLARMALIQHQVRQDA